MARRRNAELIRGHATHRRTEGDYMGVLLDTVTLEDWKAVVKGALQAARDGDAQARNWLAQYLVGRPDMRAPTPLTVVVQQLNGADPVVDKITQKIIHEARFPDDNAQHKNTIRAAIAMELGEKVRAPEIPENGSTMRSGG